MSPRLPGVSRAAARVAARREANAALCGVPLTEWQTLTRTERRHLLRTAKWKERRRG